MFRRKGFAKASLFKKGGEIHWFGIEESKSQIHSVKQTLAKKKAPKNEKQKEILKSKKKKKEES